MWYRIWKRSRDDIFFHISTWFQYRNINPKCNKTSCCIVPWSRQTFWLKLNFLLSKNESVLNILVYFLEQFQSFSQGLQPLKYTLKCSQLILSSENKKILLTSRNVRLDSGHHATKYYFHEKLMLKSSTNGPFSVPSPACCQTWKTDKIYVPY